MHNRRPLWGYSAVRKDVWSPVVSRSVVSRSNSLQDLLFRGITRDPPRQKASQNHLRRLHSQILAPPETSENR